MKIVVITIILIVAWGVALVLSKVTDYSLFESFVITALGFLISESVSGGDKQ